MPGGGPTPGAAAGSQYANFKTNDLAYSSLGEGPFLVGHCFQESLQRKEVAHMAEHLANLVSTDDALL